MQNGSVGRQGQHQMYTGGIFKIEEDGLTYYCSQSEPLTHDAGTQVQIPCAICLCRLSIHVIVIHVKVY